MKKIFPETPLGEEVIENPDHQTMEQEIETHVAVETYNSAMRLRSLISRCSLALIVSYVLIIIMTAVGAGFGGDIDVIRNYIAGYLPFLIMLWLFARDFAFVQAGQWPVKWSAPTIPQILSCFMFTIGIVYIFSPAWLLVTLSEIQLFTTVPGLIFVANFSGFLSLNTLGSVILAPIAEEYMYRRLMQDRLVFWGEGMAILITALFFSLGHFEEGRLLYTFFGGLTFGYIHAKTGKMRWNILLHMAVNLVAVLVDFWYGIYIVIGISVVYVPVYLIRHRPWKNLLSGDSGLSAGAKAKTCMRSVSFWVCIILYLAVIIWHS